MSPDFMTKWYLPPHQIKILRKITECLQLQIHPSPKNGYYNAKQPHVFTEIDGIFQKVIQKGQSIGGWGGSVKTNPSFLGSKNQAITHLLNAFPI